MSKKKRKAPQSIYALPHRGLLSFVIVAARLSLGLFLLGAYRGSSGIPGRILLILLGVALVVIALADQRVSSRNLSAAVMNVLLMVGGPALLLALAGSLWSLAMLAWALVLLGILYFSHRKKDGRK